MKRHLIAALMFGLMLVAANGASAGTYEDGLEAYARQDYATALKLWKPLADLGYADTEIRLGWLYFRGHGVAQDYKEAVKWFRLAAAAGNADAQYYLGSMYEIGQGVAQDSARAHMWYNLGASRLIGDAGRTASTQRDVIAQKMTPAQIEKAQDMARKCQASNFNQCGEDGDSLMDKVRGWFSQ